MEISNDAKFKQMNVRFGHKHSFLKGPHPEKWSGHLVWQIYKNHVQAPVH